MPSQVLIFDQSRSGSHLLQRMLSKQTAVNYLDNPFSAARGQQLQWLQRGDYAKGMPEDLQSTYLGNLQTSLRGWEDAFEEAKKYGKSLMTMQHAFFPALPGKMLEYINLAVESGPLPQGGENFTVIPDALLLKPGTVPLLTIRDPRLAVPSAYRTLARFGLSHGSGRPNFLLSTGLVWSQVLYEYYVSKGIKPVIVDGDDVMTNEDFVGYLCTQIGLNPEEVCTSWSAPTAEERKEIHPMFYASQGTLIESSGIMPGRAAKNIDMAEEVRKWDDDFGEDVGLIKEAVESAMPHYRYLYERRLKMPEA